MQKLALLPIISVALIVGRNLKLANSSPPLDFFISTQKDSEGRGRALLPTIESIYEPAESNKHEHQKLVAARVLALIGNATFSHDNDLVDIETARVAWSLMERQALGYMARRVESVRPVMEQLLSEAKVSSECRQSISGWLTSLAELERWSVVMWNSWGEFPPAGLFEGSFTDLGSYKGCMGIEANEVIGEPQYCMLDFQPLVPTRPRFHSIFKRILDVDQKSGRLNGGDFETELRARSRISAHGFGSAQFRHNSSISASRYSKRTIDSTSLNSTAEDKNRPLQQISSALKAEALVELARKAQYFYYVKFRLGACLPSKCTNMDVQNMAQSCE